MTYELWNGTAIVCFCVAAVCIVVAIVMFISFDIKHIRKELSGKQIERYMQEYRENRKENKRVSIYDPSGRLIDVKGKSFGSDMGIFQAQNGDRKSLGDALAQSRVSASVKTEAGTQILAQNRPQNSDFVIIKNYVFTETSEYIG